MPITTHRYYSTLCLNSEADPCSLSYCNSTSRRASPARPSSIHKRRFGSKKALGLVRRIFSNKSKRSGFVMPYEYTLRRLSRQSLTRSHRDSPVMMAVDDSSESIADINVAATNPTIRTTEFRYTVHSFHGVGSPTESEARNVRFSHPVVDTCFRPPTASTYGTANLSVEEPEFNDQSTIGTTDSILLSHPNSAPRVRPQEMWRLSSQSISFNDEPESYEDFKNRLDGHRSPRAAAPTPVTVADRSPQLPYIARLSSIRLEDHIPVFRPSSSSSANDKRDVEKHRSQALTHLEGSSKPKSKFVLALVPREDLPESAAALSPSQIPASLTPREGRLVMPKRPYTLPSAQVYQAYNPSSPTDKSVYKPYTRSYEEDTAFQAVLEQTSDSRHSQHYKTVESDIIDDVSQGPAQHHSMTSFLLSAASPTSSDNREPSASSRVPNFSKPIRRLVSAAVAAPERFARSKLSKVPAPLQMKNGSYPVLVPQDAARFSAVPEYQRRSVDVEEAKFQKTQAKKARKLTKQKPFKTEQEKEAEAKAVDRQLRKLMGI